MRASVLLLAILIAGCGGMIGVRKRTKEDWFAEAQRSILTSNDVSEVTFNILRRRDLHENYKQDPLLPVAYEYPHIAYHSRLYLACWKDGKGFLDRLDGRIPYIEIAAL